MKQLFFLLLATSAFVGIKNETITVPMRDGVKLGIDHTRLTRRHLGSDFRLTNVYGSVVKEIIA